MSDVASRKVRGPVETLRTEFATWDLSREDWQPVTHFSLTSFRSDGTVSTRDTYNPDGSIAHSRWFYDHTGRLAESNSWMNDGPIDKTVYFYDEAGRHIRTRQLNQDGSQTVLEACSYAADGRKTKVRFLFSREAGSRCGADSACRASTGYGIEGTDTAYGALGAATMTVAYDERNLPNKVLFDDANHRPLSYVIFRRGGAGTLLGEEMHEGARSPFHGILDQAPPERRVAMAVMLKQVLGETLSSTTYTYDAQGRLLKREHRMGSLGGNCTTYRYDVHDDPIEETIEHRNREGSFDEVGNVHYSSERLTVQHNRLEHRYDAHGNWTERIVSCRPESEPNFQRSNMERRTITYYETP